MTAEERAEVLVTARLLRAASLAEWLAVGLAVVAAWGVAYGTRGRAFALGALVLGLVAILVAVRVAFDARLFEDAAAQRITRDDLDAALCARGLIPPGKVGRSWPARCRGATRLVVISAVATLLQVVAVILIGIASWTG